MSKRPGSGQASQWTTEQPAVCGVRRPSGPPLPIRLPAPPLGPAMASEAARARKTQWQNLQYWMQKHASEDEIAEYRASSRTQRAAYLDRWLVDKQNGSLKARERSTKSHRERIVTTQDWLTEKELQDKIGAAAAEALMADKDTPSKPHPTPALAKAGIIVYALASFSTSSEARQTAKLELEAEASLDKDEYMTNEEKFSGSAGSSDQVASPKPKAKAKGKAKAKAEAKAKVVPQDFKGCKQVFNRITSECTKSSQKLRELEADAGLSTEAKGMITLWQQQLAALREACAPRVWCAWVVGQLRSASYPRALSSTAAALPHVALVGG